AARARRIRRTLAPLPHRRQLVHVARRATRRPLRPQNQEAPAQKTTRRHQETHREEAFVGALPWTEGRCRSRAWPGAACLAQFAPQAHIVIPNPAASFADGGEGSAFTFAAAAFRPQKTKARKLGGEGFEAAQLLV